MRTPASMGLAGRLAAFFLQNRITPLIALLLLLLDRKSVV